MFSLNKLSSLKNKTDIDLLFTNGLSFSSGPIKVYYLKSSSEKSLKVGFSVPKKLIPLAIKRNLVKRRLKERFRRLPDSFFVNSSGSLFVVYISSTVSESSLISSFLKEALAKVLH